ncbi:MAG: hypothetical protein VB138_00320 [Burkholderia sp.]
MTTNTYSETNLEVIEKAQYCLKHGETESVENWLDLLRERLSANETGAEGAPADERACTCGMTMGHTRSCSSPTICRSAATPSLPMRFAPFSHLRRSRAAR